jgi:hypothetical protein
MGDLPGERSAHLRHGSRLYGPRFDRGSIGAGVLVCWRFHRRDSLNSLWHKSRAQKINPTGAKALLILVRLRHD